MKVMIDTNVIIDVYQNRPPFVTTSAKILKLAENHEITGMDPDTFLDKFY